MLIIDRLSYMLIAQRPQGLITNTIENGQELYKKNNK